MFSKYKTVFCDSTQALEYAYKNGLKESAIIKSSSPAVLWSDKKNIHNIESIWTSDKLEKFKEGIQELSENIFDLILTIPGINREVALCVTDAVYHFHKVIYKAACLDESDYTDPRLFIYVDGKTGPSGNIMNSPWDGLLSSNSKFLMVNYTLKNDSWTQLTTKGVSYFNRYKIAGFETIVYRSAKKIMKVLPDFFFTKELLVPNENELNIEIASKLALRGVRIRDIALNESNLADNSLKIDVSLLYKAIQPIIYKRIKDWVTPSAVQVTMSLFNFHLHEYVDKFESFVGAFEDKIVSNCKIKQSVMVNAPGNVKGFALSYVCNRNKIPVISSQHGVTVEISRQHRVIRYEHDNSTSNAMFSYNKKIIDIESKTHFNNSKHYCVGMPLRIMRMKYASEENKAFAPIVFISTNLYHMGFSLSSNTDYAKARYEQKFINCVLSKLPHKVCYKTYPEDNRRYADVDPVLDDVKKSENIELFSKKIDMRYLISNHKILVTTCATSTIGWPVMSKKPVVFINQKNHIPLTNDAYESFSKGLFVFNDDDDDYYENIREFLSKPICEIEKMWKQKENARKEMIKSYFSFYENSGAGSRAAKIILKEYLV